ncbi:MAG TPA: folylpolyglutamate synthase/dihydrofolate synthase family protein [Trichocoleus sp.]
MTDPLIHRSPKNDTAALTEVDAILNRFAHFGVELGLERIQRLLTHLGNPQTQVPILHVAGSNGKGSVCAYLSSVLAEAGYRVGRYTSPHLVSWCERISVNGQDISPVALRDLLLQVLAAIQSDQPSPTQFEVVTAAAWLYFAQQKVDIAVIEVGLGGRLDATNVCDRPLVSIITSLSREHWQRLGPTLANIAFEKAGILKPACPAVIAPQPPEAELVLQQRLTELNCPALWVKPAIDLGLGWAEFVGSAADAEKEEGTNHPLPIPYSLKYPLPLLGQHQLINSALAIATLQILQAQGWQISEKQIVQGMAKTQWLGRMQWMEWQGQPLLIDGAHNPAGAAMLRQYVDQSERVLRPVRWVIGMIGTKDHRDVLKALLRPGDRLSLVPVPDHLPADLHVLAGLAQEICPELAEIRVDEDVITGLERAIDPTSTTVLCGSLYLIGHFFSLLQGQSGQVQERI